MIWSHFTKPDEGWDARGTTNVGPYRGWKRAEDAHTHTQKGKWQSSYHSKTLQQLSPDCTFFYFVYLETPMATFLCQTSTQTWRANTHILMHTFYVLKLSAPHTWCTYNRDLQTPHAHKGTQKSHANPSARKEGVTCERKKDDLTPVGKTREVGEKRV